MTGTDDTSESGSVRNTVKQLVVAMSTVSNPILYALMNPRFRKAARRVLCCRRWRSIASSADTDTNTNSGLPIPGSSSAGQQPNGPKLLVARGNGNKSLLAVTPQSKNTTAPAKEANIFTVS